MSAFNDAQKLADAIALARSFKSGESSDKKGKKRGRVASPASTQGNPRRLGPQAPPPAPLFSLGPPPPSQRKYNGLGKFGAPVPESSTSAIIGTAGFDFLRRVDDTQGAAADDGSVTGRNSVNALRPATQTDSNGPVAASNMTTKASGKRNEPNLNAMINSLNFEEQKPDGIQTGTMLDTFFSLVSGQETAEEGRKPDESNECLIDFAEGGNAVPVTVKQKPSFEMDWVGSQASGKSAAPATEVSALPSWDLRLLDEMPATSDRTPGIPAEKKLCPRARNFVPTKAAAPNSNSQISAVTATNPVQSSPWNAQSYESDTVIQAPLVSTAGVAPFVPIAAVPAQATHHASPQTSNVADPLGSNRQVNYISSQAKPGKKPTGGLKSSMWAS